MRFSPIFTDEARGLRSEPCANPGGEVERVCVFSRCFVDSVVGPQLVHAEIGLDQIRLVLHHIEA